jgi:Restriction endonuclease
MPTVFDDLYEQIFGSRCTKEGEAFERISAVVACILAPNADVSHDQKLRGQFSKSLYQVDVLRQESGEKIFGEAKDYTDRGGSGGKVGRPDLQKLAGALPDVGADRGVFYSATDYTREARKYASAAENIVGVPIDLMHVCPSVESDADGRIKKIILGVSILLPDYDRARWNPIFTPEGQATLTAGGTAVDVHMTLDRFFDADGNEKLTVHDLTEGGFGDCLGQAETKGCFCLPGHYIKYGERLAEVHGLEYSMPFLTEKQTVEIVTTGAPKILVRAEDGTVNKLIMDEQLRRMQFDANGNVVRKADA